LNCRLAFPEQIRKTSLTTEPLDNAFRRRAHAASLIRGGSVSKYLMRQKPIFLMMTSGIARPF